MGISVPSACNILILFKFFPGSRCLRQGDPLSFVLFTLVVDVMNRLLKNKEYSLIKGLIVGKIELKLLIYSLQTTPHTLSTKIKVKMDSKNSESTWIREFLVGD